MTKAPTKNPVFMRVSGTPFFLIMLIMLIMLTVRFPAKASQGPRYNAGKEESEGRRNLSFTGEGQDRRRGRGLSIFVKTSGAYSCHLQWFPPDEMFTTFF